VKSNDSGLLSASDSNGVTCMNTLPSLLSSPSVAMEQTNFLSFDFAGEANLTIIYTGLGSLRPGTVCSTA
jgi:hypothetical protein